MDPYTVLGISRLATHDELKKAFRKKAMKWHPDRVGASSEAKDKFFEISHAYKILSKEIRVESLKGQSKSADEIQKDKDVDFNDPYLKDMLEYAITLAESGYTKKGVNVKVSQKGCNVEMAALISDRAFKLQEKFNRNTETQGNRDKKQSSNTTKKFDYQSIAALLGELNPGRLSTRKISYYLDVFNVLYTDIELGAILSNSKNHYLSKIFNRAILLFLILSASVYFFPVVYKFIPLGLLDLFQLPSVILSLMLVWSVYRKLWLLSLIGIVIFTATQTYYHYSMPISLGEGFSSVLLTSFICYLPFIIVTRGANFFFYAKSKNIIESVDLLYPELEDKQILIKNSGGVSRPSAFIVTVFISFYFLHMIPENGSLYQKYSWFFPANIKKENKDFRQIQSRANESERLYKQAEDDFNRNPPQYEQAKMSYIQAAGYGSILSSYKLGYMFLQGQGVDQDDRKAFYYFNQAVNSPLANQPHNLSMVTKWLSESYRSLGIMYLGGYGTTKNRQKAKEMFSQAVNYGAPNDNGKLMHIETLKNQNLRNKITIPVYSQ